MELAFNENIEVIAENVKTLERSQKTLTKEKPYNVTRVVFHSGLVDFSISERKKTYRIKKLPTKYLLP